MHAIKIIPTQSLGASVVNSTVIMVDDAVGFRFRHRLSQLKSFLSQFVLRNTVKKKITDNSFHIVLDSSSLPSCPTL
jgi:hypothetical protein